MEEQEATIASNWQQQHGQRQPAIRPRNGEGIAQIKSGRRRVTKIIESMIVRALVSPCSSTSARAFAVSSRKSFGLPPNVNARVELPTEFGTALEWSEVFVRRPIPTVLCVGRRFSPRGRSSKRAIFFRSKQGGNRTGRHRLCDARFVTRSQLKSGALRDWIDRRRSKFPYGFPKKET